MGMGQDLYPAILGYLGTRVLAHNQMVSLGTISPNWPNQFDKVKHVPPGAQVPPAIASPTPTLRTPWSPCAAVPCCRRCGRFRVTEAPQSVRSVPRCSFGSTRRSTVEVRPCDDFVGWGSWRFGVLPFFAFLRFGFWMALILDGGIWVIIC